MWTDEYLKWLDRKLFQLKVAYGKVTNETDRKFVSGEIHATEAAKSMFVYMRNGDVERSGS